MVGKGASAVIGGHRGGDVELISLPGEGARTCEQRRMPDPPSTSLDQPAVRLCSLPCSPYGGRLTCYPPVVVRVVLFPRLGPPVAFSRPRCRRGDMVRLVLLINAGEVDEKIVSRRHGGLNLQAELLVQVLRGKGKTEGRR